ncbi:MAG: hypothetical protein PF693_02165 [Spirochaetia bacterium]|nr:hypothetical protein [Spirochaetia bacterium]
MNTDKPNADRRREYGRTEDGDGKILPDSGLQPPVSIIYLRQSAFICG